MAPILLTLLQAVLLLLLYLFVARAVRAVIRDMRASPPAPSPAGAPPGAARHAGAAQGAGAPVARDTSHRPAPSELVVHAPQGQPEVVRLDTGDVTFGRGRDATVRLSDSFASERHARVYRDRGQWLVTDLGSTNGTFLNRTKVTGPTPIAAGDQLGIGETTVEVRR